MTEAEAAALTAVGEFLGSVYRGELAGRIRCGVLDRDGRAAWRAGRKQAITAVSSSRWAGAITRTACCASPRVTMMASSWLTRIGV